MSIVAEATYNYVSLRDGHVPCHCQSPDDHCRSDNEKAGCDCCNWSGERNPNVLTSIKYNGSHIVLKREVCGGDDATPVKTEMLTLPDEEFQAAFCQIAALLGWKRDG